MKYFLILFYFLFCLVFNFTIYSQSVGVRLGSSYYSTYLYYNDVGSYKYFDIPLKSVFIEYDHDLFTNFQIYLAAGYGWNNYSAHEQYGDPNSQSFYTRTSELKSNGIPIELGLKFHQNLNADSTIETIIGIGIGYCNYKSTVRNGYSHIFESVFNIKGFSQYLSIGMNIHITEKIKCFFELKKMILNNLKVSGDLEALREIENSSFSQDYATSTGFFDVGLDIGISYRL